MLRIQKNPPALTPNKYEATVIDVKSVDGQYGPRLVWTVDITYGVHTYRAQGYTDTSFYEGSMEHRWASAILGMTLMADEEISEEELKGASIIAEIDCKPGRDGLKMFYNIKDILPLAGMDSSTAKATVPADEEDVPFNTPPADANDKPPF